MAEKSLHVVVLRVEKDLLSSTSHMLPKLQRLPHSVRLHVARSLRTEFFIVKTAPNNLALSRFGVVISKKVDKRAVVRNRMRRLIHQAIYEQQSWISGGYDTLFLVQKPFVKLSETLIQEVSSFLQKA